LRLARGVVCGPSGRVAENVPGIIERNHPPSVAAVIRVILAREDTIRGPNYLGFRVGINLQHLIEIGHPQSLQRARPI
jgi:hypothetical protein